MEDIYQRKYLIDTDSEEDERDEGGLHLSASKKKNPGPLPGINSFSASRISKTKNIFVSSADRDRSIYPCANNFRVSLSPALKGVRSIILNVAKIPIVAGFDYVIVVLKNVKISSIMVPIEAAGFPSGTIAVLPLYSQFADGNAYFQSQWNESSVSKWRIDIPQGLQQLNELHFQLLTHGGFIKDAVTKTVPDKLVPSTIPDPSKHIDTSFSAVTIGAKWIPSVIPYPIESESDVSQAPVSSNNVYFQLEVTNDM